MINTIRAFIRLLLFFIVSLLTVLLVALGNFLIGGFSYDGAVRWKNVIIQSWARSIAFIIGLKINLRGTPPDPPFFLASNHLSYIDVVPLWRYLSATFIAKNEVKSWPFFGWGTRTLGVLFIDRDLKRDVHRMNNRISDTISESQGVILFPEGTSTKGEEVLAFNSPLLEYPASSEMPVNYATISYKSRDNSRPAHQYICWWGDMRFFAHFWELLKIPKFEATLTFGDNTITHKNRKELAKRLQLNIAKSFEPVAKRSESEKV